MTLRIFAVLTLLTISSFAQKPSAGTAEPGFLMEVRDVFTIAGMGTVVTGTIERGSVRVGDAVEIIGMTPTRTSTVTRITVANKPATEANAATEIGVLLKGIEKTDVHTGQVLAAPGSIKPVTKFRAVIEMAASHNLGRSTPISSGYRPQLFFRTAGFSGVVTLPDGKVTMAPGEGGVHVIIELREAAALEKGMAFTIKDMGRTVGKGVITSIDLK